MTVDMYAICPCGNGKKIKFCKCRESVGELDRVMKMVEGKQVVPALDRLSTILKEHPDAAWALAIRGRLLLDLQEYESLTENADRFIRLQPSNPLALTQRAAANLFRGDIEAAVASLLEALTESGREIDAFVLDVASVLAVSLAQVGMYLTARVYATLAMMTSGYDGGKSSMQLLQQLNGSPNINQLLKSIPALIERPADVEWGERYDEANGLLRNNKVILAQSKFESLQRVAGGEPAVLSGLLSCAIWRGHAETQSEMLRKLSACESLDLEQRYRFRAMAALVQPRTPEIAIETVDLTADVDDLEQVEVALTADSRFVAIPREMLQGIRVNENDVPPRAGFQLIDRDPPPTETLPPADQVPEVIAMLILFGKQTDREARVEVHDVRRRNLDEVRRCLAAALPDVTFNESDEPAMPLPLIAACDPPVAMIRFQGNRLDAEKLQGEVTARRMPSTIASLPLPLLGGKSLIESADDEAKRFERTVTLRIIEHYDAIVSKGEEILAEVSRLAKLEPPPTIKLTDDQIETVANEDLNRLDPEGLGAESLIYLLQRASQISATPAARRLAKSLLEVGFEQAEEEKSGRMFAHWVLIKTAPQVSQSLQYLETAKSFADQNQLPMADLLLTEVDLRLQSGDAAGFQAAIEAVSGRYGNDPEVIMQLQQMLVHYGIIRPDGSPSGAPRPQGPAAAPAATGSAESGESGLWTPESPAPPPPGGAPEQGGGSKLWVPGMD